MILVNSEYFVAEIGSRFTLHNLRFPVRIVYILA
jgi:hypothetical protein